MNTGKRNETKKYSYYYRYKCIYNQFADETFSSRSYFHHELFDTIHIYACDLVCVCDRCAAMKYRCTITKTE